MSSEKTYTVKYYEGVLPKFKGYEELDISGDKLTVHFDKTDKGTFALEVPLRFALRLHNSGAFDIVGQDGKVPAEFAAKASAHGKPGYAPKALPPDDVNKFRDENNALRSQISELTANLDEAARDYDELEKKFLALQAAQSVSVAAVKVQPIPSTVKK